MMLHKGLKMAKITIPFTIKSSDPTAIIEIDTKLKNIGIYKDLYSDTYETFGNATTSDEKYRLCENIKKDILAVIQRVANEKQVKIIVQQLIVEVNFGFKPVPPFCTDMPKVKDLSENVGDYTPITITPNK